MTAPQKLEEKILENKWMVRPCFVYDAEFSECSSFRGRFQQYFVHGQYLDCQQWKIDYKNCQLWTSIQDETAFESLIESEEKRRTDRLRPHYANTTWKKRNAPPEDWNKPLPEWFNKINENSYLGIKADELKSGAEPVLEKKDSCSIS
ncbi:UPF0545 protein C22orf39 homolog isoform X1 [Neodiprion lecontei]|uniref:Synaptic plasticity regulator PANTS n=1 Tax=Neodiprion lecontei TaxID=441921 RepID=A0ABM3G5A1_NEOLC|nr:UPF0545 protein C22orf39 homolog isoform X1 [Neodiprion lecontei]